MTLNEHFPFGTLALVEFIHIYTCYRRYKRTFFFLVSFDFLCVATVNLTDRKISIVETFRVRRRPVFVIVRPVFVIVRPMFVVVRPVFVVVRPMFVIVRPMFVIVRPMFVIVSPPMFVIVYYWW